MWTNWAIYRNNQRADPPKPPPIHDPVVLDPLEVSQAESVDLPFVGEHEPDGWTRTESTWFVDTGVFRTTFALTWDRFKSAWYDYMCENPGAGFAIRYKGSTKYDRGQFHAVAFVRRQPGVKVEKGRKGHGTKRAKRVPALEPA